MTEGVVAQFMPRRPHLPPQILLHRPLELRTGFEIERPSQTMLVEDRHRCHQL
ncbi:MAG: hypothetical protein VCF24_28350 [Candidatus Latescibacterota bacterium]